MLARGKVQLQMPRWLVFFGIAKSLPLGVLGFTLVPRENGEKTGESKQNTSGHIVCSAHRDSLGDSSPFALRISRESFGDRSSCASLVMAK
jgi:hypothetical protein